MKFSQTINDIQDTLLVWFQVNGRHWIPWKLKPDGTPLESGEKISPYGIWIAEIMLQQTQLKVVMPYWKKWINRFPTLNDLAEAHEQDVLLVWQGLGYYSRAKRIHQTAKILIQKIGKNNTLDPAVWPTQIEEWMALPGIGKTTAGSIISSAYDLAAPILDGNVKRILSRLIAFKSNSSKAENQLWELSQNLIHQKFPRNFNQALMDLGSIICTPRKPNCLSCPLKKFCLAYSLYDPEDFPIKKLKSNSPSNVIGIGVVFNDQKQVLIDQRLKNSSMGGMWEFPGGKKEIGENIETTIAREIQEELGIEVKVEDKLLSFDHLYSHKKLHFEVHICKWISGTPFPLASQQCRWVYPKEFSNYPFPAANTTIIKALNKYLQLS